MNDERCPVCEHPTTGSRAERRLAARIAAAVMEANGTSGLTMSPETLEAAVRAMRPGPYVTGQ